MQITFVEIFCVFLMIICMIIAVDAAIIITITAMNTIKEFRNKDTLETMEDC